VMKHLFLQVCIQLWKPEHGDGKQKDGGKNYILMHLHSLTKLLCFCLHGNNEVGGKTTWGNAFILQVSIHYSCFYLFVYFAYYYY